MSGSPGDGSSSVGFVRLRYWASVRAAAGVEEDRVEVTGPVSLAVLQDLARALHASSDRFSGALRSCSILVEDRPASVEDPHRVTVRPGETVEFLPPFAGG